MIGSRNANPRAMPTAQIYVRRRDNSMAEICRFFSALMSNGFDRRSTGGRRQRQCGMAGSFGYEAAHYDVSMKMAEMSLLPAVRAAGADTLLVADGTSCRHQIKDGAAREALHVARVLERALA
jgi:Fe-S oxidoreductase